jgi:hypothetical protein
MSGIYVFKQHRREIARSKNLITTNGKRIIAEYLSSSGGLWAGSIAVGSGTTAASIGNTALEFEYFRVPITARSINYGGGSGGKHRIILKATLPETVIGTIREVGIFPVVSNPSRALGESTLFSLADSTENWQYYNTGTSAWEPINTTADTTLSRVGLDCITMATTSGTTKYRLSLSGADLSQFSANDQFSFATAWDTNKPTSVDIRFVSDVNNYYYYPSNAVPLATLLDANPSTYKVAAFNKSLWVAQGTPIWDSITSVQFDVARTSGASNMYIDGVRIENMDPVSPTYGIVSRSVLTTPITKVSGSELDIEYYVDV